jgi:UDPglucose 6-dehydrogenase
MQTLIVGTGYVGLVTAVCLAKLGNSVVACDKDSQKIKLLDSAQVPFYEPELHELLQNAIDRGLLTFTTNLAEAATTADISFIAVGTPSLANGSADLSMVFGVVEELSRHAKRNSIITIKSTVPPGTALKVSRQLAKLGREDLTVVSNPEFLREGRAVSDFLNPDKLLLGGVDSVRLGKVASLYAGIPNIEQLTIETDNTSAELAKYAANSMLATRISFMNEIARISRSCGADIEAVRLAMAADPRIGPYFLNSGIGFGGSCFPKDVKALSAFADSNKVQTHILGAVDQINEEQPRIAYEILKGILGRIDKKSIAIWGISFKPETDDVREAPSLKLIRLLLESGASVKCYDPVVEEEVIFSNFPKMNIEMSATALDCLEDCDALVLVTEWAEFQHVEMKEISKKLKSNHILDCRHVLSDKEAIKAGLKLHTLSS